MSRFKDTALEIGATKPEDVAEDLILGYAFRMFLKRTSDKKYDDECVARFKGMNQEQIQNELAKDIIDGKETS